MSDCRKFALRVVERPVCAFALTPGQQSSKRCAVAPVDSLEVRARFDAEIGTVNQVARQIRSMVGTRLSHDDLVSFGREGLLDAARKYDPERGFAFRRFVVYRVRFAILDGVRRDASLPRRAHEKIRALQAATAVAEGLWEDTAAAVVGGLQSNAADTKLSDHLAAMATAMAVGISGQFGFDDEGVPIQVDETMSPEDTLAREELMAEVRLGVEALPDIEATLVRRHFLGEERLDDVAESLGLSKSWASRLLARGVGRLTERLRKVVDEHATDSFSGR